MKKRGLSKTNLAKKLGTSRAQVNRILNPQESSVTLHTLAKLSLALGVKFRFKWGKA
jgi:antitoxin HicB